MVDHSAMQLSVEEEVFWQDLPPEVLDSTDPQYTVLPWVGAIDQGTSSTRFLVFSQKGRIVASAQIEHRQYYPTTTTVGGSHEDHHHHHPQVGWHEHDPLEIWKNTVACIEAVWQALTSRILALASSLSSKSSKGPALTWLTPKTKIRLAAVGLTNQRETTVAWNRRTGLPYHYALVWDDLRTTHTCYQLTQGGHGPNRFRAQTGLPVASYFAGTKVKWLLDHVPALTQDLHDPATAADVCFGTIDSWLLFQLTGTTAASASSGTAANAGGLHVTDVTNASRWLFMDLSTQQWDQTLVNQICHPHVVPIDTALPRIHPSGHVYATCSGSPCGVPALEGVPLAAVLGDQQAALFGQAAFEPGQAKNTYGTGLFLMMNTGTVPVTSSHGLLTTVAYQVGSDQPVVYALEGSVSHAGSTIQWLRDQLKLLNSAPESETMARTTDHNDGMYMVPAFAGLFAPHWRSDARACLVGLTTTHHAGHVCRAALEAAAYQTREVFEAIMADSNVSLQMLKVDGGMTRNSLLMQFQADLLQVPVVQPACLETTSLGAAFCAGLTVGVWKNLEELAQLNATQRIYTPTMSEMDRAENWAGWKKAVVRSLGWVEEEEDEDHDKDLTEFQDAMADPISSWPERRNPWTGRPMGWMVLTTGLALGVGYLLGRSRRGP